MKTLAALLTVIVVAGGLTGIPAQNKAPAIKIVRSKLFTELRQKLKSEPKIKPDELAKYANGLLAREGLDFQFDLCEFIRLHNPARRAGSVTSKGSYKLPMKQTDGHLLSFETTRQSEDADGMCGECFVSIPATRVTKQEIDLVAGSRKYLVVRPPSFHLDEMSLVDQSMRRVLRTWQVPDQSMPLGVSHDGAKLYLETEIETLVLELSDSTPRLVARVDVDLPTGAEVEKHPTDPKNAYLSFMRFRVGDRSYIIRYSEPCT